jgi:hypothetical protein
VGGVRWCHLATKAVVAALALVTHHGFSSAEPCVYTGVGSYNDGTYLGYAFDVALSPNGTHAYVASYLTESLVVLDVTNPSSPSRAGSYRPRDIDPYDMALSGIVGVAVSADGNYAYVSTYASTFMVVDVSDPSAPSPMGVLVDTSYISFELAPAVAVSVEVPTCSWLRKLVTTRWWWWTWRTKPSPRWWARTSGTRT